MYDQYSECKHGIHENDRCPDCEAEAYKDGVAAAQHATVYVVVWQSHGCEYCNPSSGVVGVYRDKGTADKAEDEWRDPHGHCGYASVLEARIDESREGKRRTMDECRRISGDGPDDFAIYEHGDLLYLVRNRCVRTGLTLLSQYAEIAIDTSTGLVVKSREGPLHQCKKA